MFVAFGVLRVDMVLAVLLGTVRIARENDLMNAWYWADGQVGLFKECCCR
jgi:hypothetical protein